MQYDSTTGLHPRTKNLLGHPPFGRLTVIAFAGYRLDKGRQWRMAFWRCRCQEGNVIVVRAYDLLSGNTTSCGCFRQDATATRVTTHGKSHTSEFRIWWNMIERCEKPRTTSYAHYGGRGISVCEAWHDFPTFYADMGPRPSRHHSLERLNNNQGYKPENCVWATPATQARNTRRNVLLTHNGVTQCIEDWAIHLGMKRRTLVSRLYQLGWSVEDALTMPVFHGRSQA